MSEYPMEFNIIVETARLNEIEMDLAAGAYMLLTDAVADVNLNNVPGLIAEIGVRLGFGIFSMMCAGGPTRYYIGIDPYGNILYHDCNGRVARHDYTNSMRNRFLKNIYGWTETTGIQFSLFNMEDTEFFTRFDDGILHYSNEKILETQYAVVHIDGPHELESVNLTTNWFIPRVPVGGYLVYDNVNHYNHSIIDGLLIECGFEQVKEISFKRSYIRRSLHVS